jgi:hypothetical protein
MNQSTEVLSTTYYELIYNKGEFVILMDQVVYLQLFNFQGI